MRENDVMEESLSKNLRSPIARAPLTGQRLPLKPAVATRPNTNLTGRTRRFEADADLGEEGAEAVVLEVVGGGFVEE